MAHLNENVEDGASERSSEGTPAQNVEGIGAELHKSIESDDGAGHSRRVRFSLANDEEVGEPWTIDTMARMAKEGTLFDAVEELIQKHGSLSTQLADANETARVANEAARQLKKQVESLRQGLSDMETSVIQKDGAIAYLESQARNDVRSTTPSIGPENHRKSTKLPDPDKYTGAIAEKGEKGGTSSFEQWYTEMVGKLDANADHFKNEKARKHYVYSRTGGDAQSHLIPRYNSEEGSYETAEDMLANLKEIYDDPHKKRNARRELNNLKMDGKQTFASFYSEFLRLTAVAHTPLDDMIDGLYDRLPDYLKKAVIANLAQYTSHHALANYISGIDNALKQIYKENDAKKKAPASKDGGGSGNSRQLTPNPANPTAGSRPPNANNASAGTRGGLSGGRGGFGNGGTGRKPFEGKQLEFYQAGKCFNCGKEGHMSRVCPDRAIHEIGTSQAGGVNTTGEKDQENDST